ncbi:MAG: hypothetical protein ACTSXQ_01875 [Alphaproteobacteria bacterium]
MMLNDNNLNKDAIQSASESILEKAIHEWEETYARIQAEHSGAIYKEIQRSFALSFPNVKQNIEWKLLFQNFLWSTQINKTKREKTAEIIKTLVIERYAEQTREKYITPPEALYAK